MAKHELSVEFSGDFSKLRTQVENEAKSAEARFAKVGIGGGAAAPSGTQGAATTPPGTTPQAPPPAIPSRANVPTPTEQAAIQQAMDRVNQRAGTPPVIGGGALAGVQAQLNAAAQRGDWESVRQLSQPFVASIGAPAGRGGGGADRDVAQAEREASRARVEAAREEAIASRERRQRITTARQGGGGRGPRGPIIGAPGADGGGGVEPYALAGDRPAEYPLARRELRYGGDQARLSEAIQDAAEMESRAVIQAGTAGGGRAGPVRRAISSAWRRTQGAFGIGRLASYASGGFALIEALRIGEATSQHGTASLLAGTDQREQLQADLTYRESLLNVPFAGTVAGLLTDAGGSGRAEVEIALRQATLGDTRRGVTSASAANLRQLGNRASLAGRSGLDRDRMVLAQRAAAESEAIEERRRERSGADEQEINAERTRLNASRPRRMDEKNIPFGRYNYYLEAMKRDDEVALSSMRRTRATATDSAAQEERRLTGDESSEITRGASIAAGQQYFSQRQYLTDAFRRFRASDQDSQTRIAQNKALLGGDTMGAYRIGAEAARDQAIEALPPDTTIGGRIFNALYGNRRRRQIREETQSDIDLHAKASGLELDSRMAAAERATQMSELRAAGKPQTAQARDIGMEAMETVSYLSTRNHPGDRRLVAMAIRKGLADEESLRNTIGNSGQAVGVESGGAAPPGFNPTAGNSNETLQSVLEESKQQTRALEDIRNLIGGP